MTLASIFLALAVGADRAEIEEIRAQERDPLILLMLSGKAVSVGVSDILSAGVPAFAELTSFDLRSPERAGVDLDVYDHCGAGKRVACWYRETAKIQNMPNLLLVGVFPADQGGIEISTLYIDHKVLRKDILSNSDDNKLEEELLERAVQAARTRIVLRQPGQLESYMKRIVENDLRSALESNHRWRPFGSIEIETRATLIIELDGNIVGTTHAKLTRVTGVREGDRKVVLRDPRGREIVQEQPLSVRSNSAVTIRSDWQVEDAATRSIAFWGSAGVALSGIALTTISLALVPDRRTLLCAPGACEPDRGSRFAKLCDLSSDRSGCSGLGRIKVAPLGIAVFIAGASWALGEYLAVGDEPWIRLLIGIAAGAAVYTTLSVADD